jgi:putative membrane protein
MKIADGASVMGKLARLAAARAIVVSAAAFALSSQANSQPYGGWGYGGWGWLGPLHMVGWLFILALVISGLAWLARAISQRADAPQPTARRPGLDALEERYARSEINRDEYLQKRHDILGEG